VTTIQDVRAAVMELIPEQYAEGATIAHLKRQWGLSSWKVRQLVEDAGVYVVGRKSGPPMLEYCIRRHKMSDTRKRTASGEAYCEACRQERQRV
jgi:hypothetical protein